MRYPEPVFAFGYRDLPAAVRISIDIVVTSIAVLLLLSISSTVWASGLRYSAAAAPSFAQQAYIKASNPEEDDLFGYSVAISGDGNTLAVGAVFEASNATGVGGSQSNNDLIDAGAVYVFVRSGTTWTQQAYIKASNTADDDWFGTSVALSTDGNTLVVGAAYEATPGASVQGPDAGAVYVFTRSGVNWTEQSYLRASNPDEEDLFGWSVALSSDGNTLAVGAVGEASNATGIAGSQSNNDMPFAGAVYVFTRSAVTWTQQVYLKASNTGWGDRFGHRVSLSDDGNTLAVGAYLEDSNAVGVGGDASNNSSVASGAAYVFSRNVATWAQQAYIKASNTEIADWFGRSVALSGDGNTLAVGATREGSSATGVAGAQGNNDLADAGAVYLFIRGGMTWSQQAYIKASNTGAPDTFGFSVDLNSDGNTLAVGAPAEASNATGIDGTQTNNDRDYAGAAYAYTRSGAVWSQQDYVKASNTDEDDIFGRAASLSSDGKALALSGVQESGDGTAQSNNDSIWAGAVYVMALPHTITTTASPVAGGTLSCTPNPVNNGGSSTCTASAAPGYLFTAFSGACAGATCSLTNITSDKSVAASFGLIVNGSCGSSHGSTLTAAPSSNLCTAGTAGSVTGTGPWNWSCNGANGGTNAACSADIQTYAVSGTASPLAGGTVSCTPDPVNHGGSSSCTATANTGYSFVDFSGDCSGTSCDLTNVSATKSVTGNFSLDSYAVTETASPAAGGTVTCTPNPVDHGSDSSCTATPNTGYSFVDFGGDCSGASCDLINVMATKSVTGNFSLDAYAITGTASPAAGGTVTCAPNPVDHGSDSSCTATPNTGYSFIDFGGDCSGASCDLTNVMETKSVTGNFSLNTYVITETASPVAGGTVTCAPNPVNHGSDVSCAATANTGYGFVEFSGDCAGATCELVNVTSLKAVTASFLLGQYNIATTADPAAGGDVTCTPNPVDHGSDSTCVATPEAGYSFVDFSGDCTGATCDLSGVTSGQSVTANFSIDSYAISATVDPAAAGSISCTSNPADHGTGSSCTVTPSSGYSLVAYSGDCEGATCDLINITSAKTVVANMAEITSIRLSSLDGVDDVTLNVVGSGCRIDEAQFVAASGPNTPVNIEFPYGLLDFTLSACEGTATVTIIYPQLQSTATFWKESGGIYYQFPAILDATSATFTLVDNGPGDDDPTLGIIRDPGGVGFYISITAAIPMLPNWALVLLAGFLGLFAAAGFRRRGVGRGV